MKYFEYFTGSEKLFDFIKDVSEGRRVGTLVIFADEDIGNDKPLFALPINIASTLRLQNDEAFVVNINFNCYTYIYI